MGIWRKNDYSTEGIFDFLIFLGQAIKAGTESEEITNSGPENLWDLFEWLTVYALDNSLLSRSDYPLLMNSLKRSPVEVKHNYQSDDKKYIEKSLQLHMGLKETLKPYMSFIRPSSVDMIENDLLKYCNSNLLNFESVNKNSGQTHKFLIHVVSIIIFKTLVETESTMSQYNQRGRLSRRVGVLEFVPFVLTFWFLQSGAADRA